MKIKDHFLSQEIFEVKASKHKGILETVPKPHIEDISRYYDSPNYISHQATSNSLRERVYNRVKAIMIGRKKRLVMGYKREGTILDIGAGTGSFIQAFEPKNWKRYAIEPSEKLQEIYRANEIELLQDLSHLEENTFDVITLWHSLEHIHDINKTIERLKYILKPDGVCLVAVPNYNSYDAQFYKSYWAAWDVPRHLWHFSREGITSLFQSFNFVCEREAGMPFDSYYVSLLSESYRPKGIKLRAFLIGAISNLKSSLNNEYSSIIYVLRPFNDSKQ